MLFIKEPEKVQGKIPQLIGETNEVLDDFDVNTVIEQFR